MSFILNKQLILSVAHADGDPYESLYFEPDMEAGGKGLVHFKDPYLDITFEWEREKSNEVLKEREFSFYYARQVFRDRDMIPLPDPNNPNPNEHRRLAVGKAYGTGGEPLLVVVHIQWVSKQTVKIITAYPTDNPHLTEDYEASVWYHRRADSAYDKNVDFLAKQMGRL